jgi:hypothetical protein
MQHRAATGHALSRHNPHFQNTCVLVDALEIPSPHLATRHTGPRRTLPYTNTPRLTGPRITDAAPRHNFDFQNVFILVGVQEIPLSCRALARIASPNRAAPSAPDRVQIFISETPVSRRSGNFLAVPRRASSSRTKLHLGLSKSAYRILI